MIKRHRASRQARSILAAASLIVLWGGSSLALASGNPTFASAAAVAAKDLVEVRQSCQNVSLTVEPVKFSAGVEGALLHITAAHPECLGATGENQSLAVRDVDGHWRQAFISYPQTITVNAITYSGVASFSVQSVLGCLSTYTWLGKHYVERREVSGMGGCGDGPFPAAIHTIEAAINAQASDTTSRAQTEAKVDTVQLDARLGQLGSGPVGALRATIDHASTLPCWCDKSFSRAVAHYATPDLIQTVEYGARIAKLKQIDLADGDFFTAQQQVKSARLISAHIITQGTREAAIAAEIAIVYADGSIYPPIERIYDMKLVAGEWRIDDIKFERGPSTKYTFAHPEG